jgi:hypothetical protein
VVCVLLPHTAGDNFQMHPSFLSPARSDRRCTTRGLVPNLVLLLHLCFITVTSLPYRSTRACCSCCFRCPGSSASCNATSHALLMYQHRALYVVPEVLPHCSKQASQRRLLKGQRCQACRQQQPAGALLSPNHAPPCRAAVAYGTPPTQADTKAAVTCTYQSGSDQRKHVWAISGNASTPDAHAARRTISHPAPSLVCALLQCQQCHQTWLQPQAPVLPDPTT